MATGPDPDWWLKEDRCYWPVASAITTDVRAPAMSRDSIVIVFSFAMIWFAQHSGMCPRPETRALEEMSQNFTKASATHKLSHFRGRSIRAEHEF